MIYDCKQNVMLPNTVASIVGLSGFISWQRLAKHLKETGEIHPNETLAYMEMSDRGIVFVVET